MSMDVYLAVFACTELCPCLPKLLVKQFPLVNSLLLAWMCSKFERKSQECFVLF